MSTGGWQQQQTQLWLIRHRSGHPTVPPWGSSPKEAKYAFPVAEAKGTLGWSTCNSSPETWKQTRGEWPSEENSSCWVHSSLQTRPTLLGHFLGSLLVDEAWLASPTTSSWVYTVHTPAESHTRSAGAGNGWAWIEVRREQESFSTRQGRESSSGTLYTDCGVKSEPRGCPAC